MSFWAGRKEESMARVGGTRGKRGQVATRARTERAVQGLLPKDDVSGCLAEKGTLRMSLL